MTTRSGRQWPKDASRTTRSSKQDGRGLARVSTPAAQVRTADLQKKREDGDKLMQQIQENNHRKLWRRIERLAPSAKKAELQPMRGKTGKLAKSEEQMMGAWAEHLESLKTPEAHPLQDAQFGERVSIQNTQRAFLSPPTQAEGGGGATLCTDRLTTPTSWRIEALAYYKAQGSDGTLNPMYKCAATRW
jgi:hypothetical protein